MKFVGLPGYPTSAWGQTKVTSGDYIGPSNYQQPGDVVVAQAFGWTGVEALHFVGNKYSQSNNYYVNVVYPGTSSANEVFAPAFGQNASAANNTNAPVLQWYYANNNNQVANNSNLSAEVVPRMMAFGV